MNRARFQRVAAIFEQAILLEGEQRAEYVARACAKDETLRAEVESLLARHRPGEPGRLEAAQHTLTREPEPAVPPQTIGPYQVRRVIAAGAMGTVYEAVQDDPHRVVALKVLRRGATSPSLLTRFRHEAEFLGRLHHPHIAQVYDASTHDDGAEAVPWFAMEYVEGLTLTEHARTAGLGVRERVELLLLICDAVQHAHSRGIIHRDLKPENILVDERGEPRILDFGIARATDADLRVTTLETGAGLLVGTIPYMSPEQIGGLGEPDARSDTYALGVILYELLAGRLPHDLRGKTVPEAARIIQQDEPSSLGHVNRTFRGDLETIVAKALEKDPDRRYASAADLAADLRHFLRDEPIVARPASTFYQLSKFARRNPALVGGVGASFVLLIAGIVGIARQLQATQEEVARFQQLHDFVMGTFALLNPAPTVDPLHPPSADGRLPAAETLLLDAAERLESGFERWPENRADLHLRLGLSLWGVGRFDDAHRQIEQAVRLRVEHLGVDHLDTYRARMWRHQIMMRSGQPVIDEARKAIEVADGIARLAGAPLHDVLTARLIAANYLLLDGDTEQAIAWVHEVRARAETEIPEDPIVFDVGAQLAFSLSYVNRHEEAVGYLLPLLERARAEVDEHDIIRRNLAARLAATFNSVGLHQQALAVAQEAVDLGKIQSAPALTLYDMRAANYLAAALRGMGRTDDALEVLRRRIDECREHLGDHSYTLWAVAQLARMLGSAFQDDEASALIRAELAAVEGTELEADVHVAVLHAALAESLGRQGCIDDAARHWRIAIEMSDGHGQSSIVLGYRQRLALLFERAKRWDEAEAAWRDRLAKAESDFPLDRRTIAYTRRSIAWILRWHGAPEELEEAAVLAGVAARELEDVEGAGHHWTLMTRRMHAMTLHHLGRDAEAERLLKEALRDAERERGADDWRVPWLRDALGRCLAALGRYEEAEVELMAALEGLQDPEDPGDMASDRERQAREHLAELYEAWGKPERMAALDEM